MPNPRPPISDDVRTHQKQFALVSLRTLLGLSSWVETRWTSDLPAPKIWVNGHKQIAKQIL